MKGQVLTWWMGVGLRARVTRHFNLHCTPHITYSTLSSLPYLPYLAALKTLFRNELCYQKNDRFEAPPPSPQSGGPSRERRAGGEQSSSRSIVEEWKESRGGTDGRRREAPPCRLDAHMLQTFGQQRRGSQRQEATEYTTPKPGHHPTTLGTALTRAHLSRAETRGTRTRTQAHTYAPARPTTRALTRTEATTTRSRCF